MPIVLVYKIQNSPAISKKKYNSAFAKTSFPIYLTPSSAHFSVAIDNFGFGEFGEITRVETDRSETV